jgi:hypothetical protein
MLSRIACYISRDVGISFMKLIEIRSKLWIHLCHELWTSGYGILFLHCGFESIPNLVCWCCNFQSKDVALIIYEMWPHFLFLFWMINREGSYRGDICTSTWKEQYLYQQTLKTNVSMRGYWMRCPCKYFGCGALCYTTNVFISRSNARAFLLVWLKTIGIFCANYFSTSPFCAS